MVNYSLGGLLSLQVLTAKGNSIKTISESHFQGLNALKVLNFGHNDIEEFHLPKLESLTKLIISANEMTGMQSYIFFELPALQEIRMRNMKMSELSLVLPSTLTSLNLAGSEFLQQLHIEVGFALLKT